MPKVTKFSGLQTSHNPVGSVPEGGLAVATNCVTTEKDVIEPRRGQKSLTYTFGSGSDRASALWSYGTSLLVHYGTAITLDTGAAFTNYTGTFTDVDSNMCRMRGVEAAQNFYANTATGVKVLDSGGSFSSAGVPQCLECHEVGMTIGASGYLALDRAVAYRALVGQKDANNVWHYGAPSQRTVVRNQEYDIPIAGPGLQRAANVVTVLVYNTPDGPRWLSTLRVGDIVTLTTTEANFTSGAKTIASINPGVAFTYSEAGANANSTIIHTFTVPARSAKIAVGIPSGVTSSDVIQLFRTETAPSAATDPGDEVYQVGEQNPPAAVSVTAGNVTATSVATGADVVVTSNSHPYVVGQAVECSGQANIPAGTNYITATTANTFTYYDPTAATQVSGQTLTYTPRTVVFDDNAPESMLGDPLYTNPNTGDGLQASAYEPPVAKDMVRGGGRMWWLNTTDKHRIEIQMLGAPAANEWIQFTRSGTDYRYTVYEALTRGYWTTQPTQRTWMLHDTDTPAANVEAMSKELVRCINQDDSSCPFYAVYASAENDVPGKIHIIEKAVGGAAITVTASDPAYWSPILADSGTTVSSTNDSNPAGVMWSDVDDPESVPLANRLTVDAKNDPILRGAWLRDSLFVFKKYGGVFLIPNQAPYRAREVDPTCRLIAPDTVVACNNMLFALTTQGLCTVTEAGVDVIGWPIDYDVRSLVGPYTANGSILTVPFAVAYESERSVLMYMPSTLIAGLAYSQFGYVYNHATRSFMKATHDRTCGLVRPDTDTLYMGHGTSNTLVCERKSFTAADYADEEVSVTITNQSGTTVTLSSASSVSVGDVLRRGDVEGVVTAKSSNDLTVTITSTDTAFGNGSATVYKAFASTVELLPQADGEPATAKQVGRVTYSFKGARFHLGKATVWTDEDTTQAEYSLSSVSSLITAIATELISYDDLVRPVNVSASFGTMGSFVAPGFKLTQARAPWRLIGISTGAVAQSDRRR